jgi:hypothetical protein
MFKIIEIIDKYKIKIFISIVVLYIIYWASLGRECSQRDEAADQIISEILSYLRSIPPL